MEAILSNIGSFLAPIPTGGDREKAHSAKGKEISHSFFF